MSTQDFLTNQFLIAMPKLDDPNFEHTVTYICEHTDAGALGIVINRPLGVDLGDILGQLEIESEDEKVRKLPVFLGGPVEPQRGFVIHEPPGRWEATLEVTACVGVTSSRDILAAIADGSGPDRNFIALGYAGWGAGQLEEEIANNAWLSTPADMRIVFETPTEERWSEAARLMGIDLSLLSGEAGHA